MIQIRTTGELYRDGVMVGRIEPPELAREMAAGADVEVPNSQLLSLHFELRPVRARGVARPVLDEIDMTIGFAPDQLFPRCCPMCGKARVGIEEGKIHVARFECETVMRAAVDSLKGGSVVKSCQ